MKIKYKILIFFQIYFCILNDSWAEVKIEKVVPPINVKPVAPENPNPPINVTPVVPDNPNPPPTDNVAPVAPENPNPPINVTPFVPENPNPPPTDNVAPVAPENPNPPINVTPVVPDNPNPPPTDNVAPVVSENSNPPINVTPVVPDNPNPPPTDNVAPVAPDNVNTSTTDNNLSKTAIDSKINASMKGESFDPELKKISANNYAIGISFGKKFEANNLFNFSEKYSEYFNNKFILAELFFNKNINKKTSRKNIEIDSLQGFRSGFGSNFKNIHLVITSNIFTANLSKNKSNNNKDLLFLFGVTGGYKLNKNIDLRCNIISSFGRKIRVFNNNFNNFDLSMAINL